MLVPTLDFGLELNFCCEQLFWPGKISLFLLLLKQAIGDFLLVTEILYFQHGWTYLDINTSSHAELYQDEYEEFNGILGF